MKKTSLIKEFISRTSRLPEMKEYDVVLASGAEHLKSRFEEFGYRTYTCETNYDGRRLFPNADIYVRVRDIEELADRRVLVVQACTGSGPAEAEKFTTSDRIVELLLILDLLAHPTSVEEIGHKQYAEHAIVPPSNVETVLTFEPCALQDKAFRTGEAVSARWALEAIANGCNKVWVVNPHTTDNLPWIRKLIDRGLYEEINVIPDLVEFAQGKFGFDEYTLVTPDEGGQERFDVEGFCKKRSNSFSVKMVGDLNVKGKDVIIIDDLTKSGSTLLEASNRLYKQDAKTVGMAVVHVLPLIEKDEELLENLVAKSEGYIVTSNTVNTRIFCGSNPSLCYNIVDTLVKHINHH